MTGPLTEESLRWLSADPARSDVRSMAQELLTLRAALAEDTQRMGDYIATIGTLRAKLAEAEKDTQRLRLAIEPAWREGYDAGVDDATSFEWGHRKSTPYEKSEAFDAARQKEEASDD